MDELVMEAGHSVPHFNKTPMMKERDEDHSNDWSG